MSNIRYVQRQRLKGKHLKVFGFGDLVRQKGSKWKIPVFMLDEKGKIEEIEFLFSTIGDLRLGQVFDNGFPRMPKSENVMTFSLPPSSEWSVAKVSDYLKRCPFFHKQKALIEQNLFVVKLENSTVYIPQLELAKILFFKKAILTRHAFQATGLSLFAYNDAESYEDTKINFLPDVPMNILDDSVLLKHLSWIYSQPDVLSSFSSCFTKMSKQNGTINSDSQKFTFEFSPPNLENVKLTARYSQSRLRHFYVDEILGLEALPMPQKNTIFTHPYANRYQKSGGGSGGESANIGAYNAYSEYGVQIDSDDVGETKNVAYVDVEKVELSYSHPVKYSIDRSVMPVGDKNKKGAYPAVVTSCAKGGFDESIDGGKQKQLELDSIHNPEIINFHLDHFIEEINTICELNRWDKGYDVIFLPRVGRHKFHLIGPYTRQAILLIIKTDKHFCYLVEVQTDDDKALSTLIFKRQLAFSKEERVKFFNELIVRLIKASGHWKEKDINKIIKQYQMQEYLRFKHPPRAAEQDKVELRHEAWKQRLTKWIVT